MNEQVCEAFCLVAEIGNRLGVSPLNKMSGLWCYQMDEHWEVRANGHNRKVEGVPPYTVALHYDGCPAGLVNPSGGIMLRIGKASEDAFCEAAQAHLEKLKGGVFT